MKDVGYADRVVFANQFESLWLKALNGRVTAPLKKALIAHGVDLSQLKPADPFLVRESCLAATAEWLYGQSNYQPAYEDLGYRSVQGYFDSAWGGTFRRLLTMRGPKRTFVRAQRIFRASNNFANVKLTELEGGRFQVWVNDVGRAIFFTKSVLRAGIEKGGVRRPRKMRKMCHTLCTKIRNIRRLARKDSQGQCVPS